MKRVQHLFRQIHTYSCQASDPLILELRTLEAPFVRATGGPVGATKLCWHRLGLEKDPQLPALSWDE